MSYILGSGGVAKRDKANLGLMVCMYSDSGQWRQPRMNERDLVVRIAFFQLLLKPKVFLLTVRTS